MLKKLLEKDRVTSTVWEEFLSILTGRCFRPLKDTDSLVESLRGKSVTSLQISISSIAVTKLIVKDDGISVIGTKIFINEKSQDFVSFVNALMLKDTFLSELSFGCGILISILPNDFMGESISPSQMHIPMSYSVSAKSTKFCDEIQDPVLQAKWLEYWLDKDPVYTIERCASALPVSPQCVYRAMYLPGLNEFVLAALPREIVDFVQVLSKTRPILDISYLPFQLITMGYMRKLFSSRAEMLAFNTNTHTNTNTSDEVAATDSSNSSPAPVNPAIAHKPTEYSGLWGTYIFDHIITFAWRDTTNSEGTHTGFFGSSIKYCPQQSSSAAMQSSMDSIFRDSAAFFVRNVLRTSSTINANPEEFMLFCTDADSTKKSLLLPILQNSLMRPATSLNMDEKVYSKIFGFDSRLSSEMKFFICLQLGIQQ